MPHPPAPLLFASSLLVRFLIALLLGAQVGLLVFLTPAQGWLSLVPVLILLVAPLLSLAGDPAVRRGSISRQRLLRALGRALLVLVAPVLALAVLGMLFPPVWLPARLVVFLATSLLIAFSVGGRIVWQADSAALIGWLGFGIMAVLDGARLDAAYQSTPGFHFDPLPAVAAATTWVLLGFFAVALPGGHLGRLLRTWMWDHP